MEEYPFKYPMGKTNYELRGDPPKKNVSFEPQLCLQRYAAVLERLTEAADKDDIRIVTEYGPNKCRFLHQALQTSDWLERINLVDVDAEVIAASYFNLCEPHYNRTARGRIRKLTAVAYHGNIACSDHRTAHSDAVIGIELIEHLTAADFKEFPRNVFGYIQPKYVIFTTPNCEFNVLFKLPAGKFRHEDHKFEFSRAEFRQWAQEIVDTYPSYEFRIYGIGAPPPDVVEDVGFASQMVVFVRISEPVSTPQPVESYTLIGDVVLNCGDSRTDEEKLLTKLANSSSQLICDFAYQSSHSVFMRQERCQEGHTMDVVPVQMVVKYLEKEDLHKDVDTVIMAVREFSSIRHEVETTIALGPVFVERCECDGNYHESAVQAEPSLFFYALPSPSLSINNVGWLQDVESVDIRRYVEEFVEAAADRREFLLVTTRESCALDHSISFLTPQVVVAHLKAGGIETDSKTVLEVWREANSEKYPLEETSFGYVIIVEKYCGDSPCIAEPEDGFWDDDSYVDSLTISDSMDDLKLDDGCCAIDTAEE